MCNSWGNENRASLTFCRIITPFNGILSTHFLLVTPAAPKGLLHLSPDVYQEMEASRKQGGGTTGPGSAGGGGGGSVSYMTPKEMGPCPAPLSPGHPPYYAGSPSSPSPTATMARELQLNGQSPTADAPSLPIKGKSPPMACGVSVQPAQQLDYLAHIQNFQVSCKESFLGLAYPSNSAHPTAYMQHLCYFRKWRWMETGLWISRNVVLSQFSCF